MQTTSDDTPLTAYLVEYRGEDSGMATVGVVRALEQAVTRLVDSGVTLRWLCSVVEPEQPRCMCFVAAANVADVVRARDVAGLPSARVARVVHVTDHLPRHSPVRKPQEG